MERSDDPRPTAVITAPAPPMPAPTPTLTARATAVVVLVGLLTAAVATFVGGQVVAREIPRFRAHARVTLAPAPGVSASLISKYETDLGTGTAAHTADAVIGDAQQVQAAADAIAASPADLTITTTVSPDSLIDLTLDTSSAAGAERALGALLDSARPVVQDVAGPYVLVVLLPPARTATSTRLPGAQVLPIVFLVTLFLGCGVALAVRAVAVRSSAGPAGPEGQAQPSELGPLP
jgi:hypothetical protein